MKTEQKNALGNIAGWTLAVSSSTIRVRPSAAFYAFCLTFVAVGAGLVTASLLFMKEAAMLPLIVGAVFLLAGAVTLHVVRKKKVPEFDLMQECFYPGGRAVSIRELSDGEPEKIPFREMRGLRIDSHIRGSGKNSHRVFELELLCSGDRSYVVLRRAELGAFCRDAGVLSRALGLPPPVPCGDWPKIVAAARRGQLALAGFGLFFFAVSLVVGYFVWMQGALAMLRAGDWAEVPALVRRSAVKRSGSGKNASYRFEVEYQYRFGTRLFCGTAYDFWDSVSSTSQSAAALHRKYLAGTTCKCWVNPAAPAEAVLSRSWRFDVIVAAFFIGIFSLFGAGMAGTALRTLCRKLPDWSGGGAGENI